MTMVEEMEQPVISLLISRSRKCKVICVYGMVYGMCCVLETERFDWV